jgi:hypothetical protein
LHAGDSFALELERDRQAAARCVDTDRRISRGWFDATFGWSLDRAAQRF